MSLQLGGNNQKKFITQLYEISQREGVGLEDLLQSQNMVNIIDDNEMLPSQKSSIFLQLLKQMNNPRLSAAQVEFESQLKQLNLPDNISITSSPFFEIDEVTLAIKYRSFAEFKSAWHNLANNFKTKAS